MSEQPEDSFAPQELDEFMRIVSQGLSEKEFSNEVSKSLDEELRLLSSYDVKRVQPGQVVVLYSNITDPDLVALSLKGRGMKGRVVALENGTAVFRRVKPQEITVDKLDELFTGNLDGILGDEGPLQPEIERYACGVSTLIPYGVVCLVATMDDSPAKRQAADAEIAPEEQLYQDKSMQQGRGGVQGQVAAKFYRFGNFERSLPTGAFISALDPLLEDLLLGRTTGTPHRINYKRLYQMGINITIPPGTEMWEDAPGFWEEDPEDTY